VARNEHKETIKFPNSQATHHECKIIHHDQQWNSPQNGQFVVHRAAVRGAFRHTPKTRDGLYEKERLSYIYVNQVISYLTPYLNFQSFKFT
jgi:hypothetical protein